MKFEANIPSYLKTGSGAFKVGGSEATAMPESDNLFEKIKFNRPSPPKVKPMAIQLQDSVGQTPNLFQQIQNNMASGGSSYPIRPMMPEELPELEEDLPEKPGYFHAGDKGSKNMEMAGSLGRKKLLQIYNDSEIGGELGPGNSYTTDELEEILFKLHGDMLYGAKDEADTDILIG